MAWSLTNRAVHKKRSNCLLSSLRAKGRLLLRGHAAVRGEDRVGSEPAFVAGKKQDAGRDFLGRARLCCARVQWPELRSINFGVPLAACLFADAPWQPRPRPLRTKVVLEGIPLALRHPPLLRSGGFLAIYNLISAAAAAGVNHSTVLRAIKAGASARNVTQRFNA
jgi:hypothetical protein